MRSAGVMKPAAARRPWPGDSSAAASETTRPHGKSRPTLRYHRGQTVGEQRPVRERLMAALSGAFGALAGLLAAVGLTASWSTPSRAVPTKSASGSRWCQPLTVLRMVIVEAGWLVGIGSSSGRRSVWRRESREQSAHGLKPTDPVTIGAAALLLATIGFVASFLPARRASRVDPMNVLVRNPYRISPALANEHPCSARSACRRRPRWSSAPSSGRRSSSRRRR